MCEGKCGGWPSRSRLDVKSVLGGAQVQYSSSVTN